MAFACAVMMGVPAGQAVTALATAPAAPGRLEPVIDPRGTRVLVDYAHTPEALERVLHALRPNCAGRLLVLAGCGGDRDTTKRAPMGQAAVGGADLAILTSDNPRGEEPRDILEQMRQGAEQAGSQALTVSDLSTARSGHALVVDRRDAIHAALAAARPEDTVLIAGKGHEDYQIVKGERRDFDDRLVAAEALRALGEET